MGAKAAIVRLPPAQQRVLPQRALFWNAFKTSYDIVRSVEDPDFLITHEFVQRACETWPAENELIQQVNTDPRWSTYHRKRGMV